MKIDIQPGKGTSQYGTGIDINLTGDQLATAITAYLHAHNIHINGSRTVSVNGQLCKHANVYVDPSGFVIKKGKKYNGRTGLKE